MKKSLRKLFAVILVLCISTILTSSIIFAKWFREDSPVIDIERVCRNGVEFGFGLAEQLEDDGTISNGSVKMYWDTHSEVLMLPVSATILSESQETKKIFYAKRIDPLTLDFDLRPKHQVVYYLKSSLPANPTLENIISGSPPENGNIVMLWNEIEATGSAITLTLELDEPNFTTTYPTLENNAPSEEFKVEDCLLLPTHFTHSRHLAEAAGVTDGLYDIHVGLYDQEMGGKLYDVNQLENVPVVNGKFNTTLDFGTIFDGRQFWLDVQLTPSGSVDPNEMVTLLPRQLTYGPNPVEPPPNPTQCGGLRQEGEAASIGVSLSGNGAFEIGHDSATSGGHYIEAMETRPIGTFDPDSNATYCITIPESGMYAMRVRASAPDSMHNSLYLYIDEAPSQGYSWHPWATGDYVVNDVFVASGNDPNPARFVVELSAGEHQIAFSSRESGTKLDWFEFVQINEAQVNALDTHNGSVSAASVRALHKSKITDRALDLDGDVIPDVVKGMKNENGNHIPDLVELPQSNLSQTFFLPLVQK